MSGDTVERRAWLVAGRVQGVGFRAATRRRADELGLGGVAENLADGRVRVVATGAADALERLAAWLAHGPPAARVDSLVELDAPPDVAGANVVTR